MLLKNMFKCWQKEKRQKASIEIEQFWMPGEHFADVFTSLIGRLSFLYGGPVSSVKYQKTQIKVENPRKYKRNTLRVAHITTGYRTIQRLFSGALERFEKETFASLLYLAVWSCCESPPGLDRLKKREYNLPALPRTSMARLRHEVRQKISPGYKTELESFKRGR